MAGRWHSRSIDPVFLACTAGIVVFGLAMLLSASGSLAIERFGDPYWYVRHQVLYGVLPGVVLCFIASRIPTVFWKRIALPFFLVSLALLVLVLVPGVGADFGSARSWISVGFFSFQPGEIVKLAFLLYLAAWFENRGEKRVKDVHAGLVPFLIALGAVVLLMVLQPDVGTMSVVVAIACAVYFSAGAPLTHLGLLGGGGVLLFFLLIKLAPYRAARFTTFLHPELDPQGIGYHINQALLAIGSGGLFGLGFGHSRQKYQYLPEVAGDSIFAVLSEELGFFLSAGVILFFALLAHRLLRIAAAAPDAFSRFVTIGVMAWITFQAFVNIGAMLGLLPITGIPLPFVSYGGTSAVVLLTSIGIVMGISRRS